MSYLYITENGASLSIEGGYFVVHYAKSKMEKRIPKETLESIGIFGNISVTTPCLKECLTHGIPICYYSTMGKYFGRTESTSHVNIKRMKKQLRLSENAPFALELAKNMVEAKIQNQKVILKRYLRTNLVDLGEELKQINISAKKAQYVGTVAQLMGFEGNAAKYYFQGLSKMVKKEFQFSGRNRMPPKDPFNSMLSLGYTILMNEIYGVIESCGLLPYAGFLHQDQERHPTLASDLMEEWRAVLVDSVVMSLVQGNEISRTEFHKDEESGGIFLSKDALKIFIAKLEKKFRSETGYIESTYRMSFRHALKHQVTQLVNAIEAEDAQCYHPIRIR